VLILAAPLPIFAHENDGVPTREAMTEEIIRVKFFRKPLGVLWTSFGEDETSYVLQVRHGFVSNEILPNLFDQFGFVPTAITGDITYDSNPTGEEGAALWSRATAHYDKLFGNEYLEGRAIYQDIKLDSYLGAGVGFVPVHNSWIGGYYLGSKGYMLAAEVAKAIDEDFWVFATAQYYTDNDDWQDALEGEIGLVYDDLIWLSVQNEGEEFKYKIGFSQPLP